MNKKEELLKELTKLQTIVSDKLAAIASVKAAFNKLKELNGALIVKGQTLKEAVRSNARKAFSLWKKNNLLYRPDGRVPESFRDDYPFTFND